MVKKWTREAPVWFVLGEYAVTNSFNRLGWARMIGIRQYFQDLWDFEPATSKALRLENRFASNRGKIDFWNQYLSRTFPSDEANNPECKDYQEVDKLYRTDAIKELHVPGEDKLHKVMREIIYELRDLTGRKLLIVDPHAPDTEITNQFKHWHAKMREEFPLPVKRKGKKPKDPNAEVTDQELDSWVNYRVLALYDLDFGAEVLGQPKLVHECLHSLLVPGQTEPGELQDWGRSARRVTEKAMDCADLLYLQSKGGAR